MYHYFPEFHHCFLPLFGLILVILFSNWNFAISCQFFVGAFKISFLNPLDCCIQLYDIIKQVHAACKDSKDVLLQPLDELLDQAITLVITLGKLNASFFVPQRPFMSI